jgi:hypothetical protein
LPFDAADFFASWRLSFRQKPRALNITPTVPNTLRSRPPHTGHSVSESSVNACTAERV